MPKRTDISKILVIGGGPTVIGQAGELDVAEATQERIMKFATMRGEALLANQANGNSSTNNLNTGNN